MARLLLLAHAVSVLSESVPAPSEPPGCTHLIVTTVTVADATSIYNGYTGFVQRISGDRAAVLFEGGNWDKLVTMRLKDLQPA